MEGLDCVVRCAVVWCEVRGRGGSEGGLDGGVAAGEESLLGEHSEVCNFID